MVSTYNTKDPESTKKIARDLVAKLQSPNVICLFGDLASGKTTFTQGIGLLFGIEHIISPTYVIAKQYPIKHQLFDQLVHLDLYRLDNIDDLKAMDMDEIWTNPHNLVVIEWPEKILDFLPVSRIDIHFKNLGEDKRMIEISK